MIKTPIGISAIASVSPLGATLSEAWAAYITSETCLVNRDYGGKPEWVGVLPPDIVRKVQDLAAGEPMYDALDDSVKYALLASRTAMEMAGWKHGTDMGINIGSSRGATGLFEKYHSEYLSDQRSSVLASPTTTLGNISSWVAHDLQTEGPDISHSITCSTALHALLNGIAWIQAGISPRFLVGGSEAPLTPFTLAQMKALKIYAAPPGKEKIRWPCRALDLRKSRNSMVLGEGASIACIEHGITPATLAVVEGMGYATEPLAHPVSLSAEADCLERSMSKALGDNDPSSVDVVVMHAPGTIKGDLAEYRAVQKVFGQEIPALTTNKWKIGHTFGASGMLSIEMALLMLKYGEFIPTPFYPVHRPATPVKRILVNAVGFGGNAVSILLRSA